MKPVDRADRVHIRALALRDELRELQDGLRVGKKPVERAWKAFQNARRLANVHASSENVENMRAALRLVWNVDPSQRAVDATDALTRHPDAKVRNTACEAGYHAITQHADINDERTLPWIEHAVNAPRTQLDTWGLLHAAGRQHTPGTLPVLAHIILSPFANRAQMEFYFWEKHAELKRHPDDETANHTLVRRVNGVLKATRLTPGMNLSMEAVHAALRTRHPATDAAFGRLKTAVDVATQRRLPGAVAQRLFAECFNPRNAKLFQHAHALNLFVNQIGNADAQHRAKTA